MKAMVLSLVVLGAVGCGGVQVDMSKVVAPPERAEEAIQAVYDAYGMRSMPTVYWYGGDALDCNDGLGFRDQFGTCVGGDQGDGIVIVAAPTGVPISQAGNGRPEDFFLGHEMAHEASDQLGEGGDAGHTGHFFAPGGDMERAKAALVASGM